MTYLDSIFNIESIWMQLKQINKFQNLECHQKKFHSLEWDIDKDAKFEILGPNGR